MKPTILTLTCSIMMIMSFASSDTSKYFTNPSHLLVNTITGDASYIEKFDDIPNINTNEKLRLTTHLEYVEKLLRSKDVSHLSIVQQQQRLKMLDLLHEYWIAGVFPVNYDYPGERRPCFIDKNDNICAVGYLVEKTAGIEVAEKINEQYQYEYLMNMEMPELTAWIAQSGLTKKECAMIQPGYGIPTCNIENLLFTLNNDTTLEIGYGIGFINELPTNFIWSTGETTRSIKLNSPGNYCVTVSCAAFEEVYCYTYPNNPSVQDSCKADFASFFDPNVNIPGQVLFKDKSDDTDDDIVAWNWNFGDGATSTDQNPLYTYDRKGAYDVCLSIEANNGCLDSLCETVWIDPDWWSNPPSAGITECDPKFIPVQDTSKPGEIYLVDVSVTPEDWLHRWDFGEGNLTYSLNPTITYNSAKTVNICLTVEKDIWGGTCSQTFCDSIVVDAEGLLGNKKSQSWTLKGISAPQPKITIGFSDNINLNESIRVFPNPTTGIFSLDISAEFDQEAIVKVMDIMGKQIKSDEVLLVSGQNNLVFDWSKFQNGIYMIDIQSEALNTTFKIVKN